MLAHLHLLLELAKTRQSFKAIWAQPRRIKCEHCHESFVYLAWGRVGATVEAWRGTAAASNLPGLGRERISQLVAKASSKKRMGAALCPHCRRYQEWMIRASRSRPFWWSVIVGVLSGATAGALYSLNVGPVKPLDAIFQEIFEATAIGASAGVGLGLLLGSIFGLASGVQLEREELGSLTEKEWEELVGRQRRQPAIAFFARLGRKRKASVELVPLPLRDETET
ncbi:hypothetical protein HY251_06475 [bacterium]|nr:hypothetical protein [bacterium]